MRLNDRETERSQTPGRALGLVAALALTLSACASAGGTETPRASTGSSQAPASAPASEAEATPRELTSVTIRMPFLMSGYDAPFLLGVAQGFFEEEGIDAHIEEGQGSQTTAQLVANGQDDYGFADAATVATLIAKGAPARVIAVMQQQGSHAFIYQPPVELNTVEDLVGTTILSDGSAPFVLLPAVLEKNSGGTMTVDDLNSVIVESSAYQQSFLSTDRAVLLGNIYSTFQSIKRQAPETKALLYSSLGVNLLGQGMVASTSKIESKPDEVAAVMRAVVRSWEAAIADPGAAIDALLAAYPDLDSNVARDQLDQFLELVHTTNTEGKPFGWMSPDDWQQSIELLTTYMGVDASISVDDYYTNDFVPGT